MTNYSGKLLYRTDEPTLIDVLGHVRMSGFEVYACNIWNCNETCSAGHWDPAMIDYGVSRGCMHVVDSGDIIVRSDGAASILTAVHPMFSWETRNADTECIEGVTLSYESFFKFAWSFDFTNMIPVVRLTNNKNRATCFHCQCPTEDRRDFADMSVRAFCPRCKV